MGKKKKNRSWTLKIIYIICVIVVFIAGLYYENGYRDINTFINDINNKIFKISTTITNNVGNTLSNDNVANNKNEQIPIKNVKGTLQMHLIDVGQRRQHTLYARN